MLIVNKYGLFHEIPAGLLATVERQGGRVATDSESQTWKGGAARVDGGAAPVAQPPAPKMARPWPDFDALTVGQVLARCVNLSAEGKAAVLAYELISKKRKGIIEALGNE